MFANIVRADSYRFVRSRFARIAAVCFVLLLALFALMMHGGGTFAFGGVIGHKDGVALIDGFYGFGFTDPAHPAFWELLYTASCFGLFAILGMVLTMVMVVSADDRDGITKLAVAGGQSQERLFLSKVLIVTVLTAVLWLVHNGVSLLLTLAHYDQSVTAAQVRTWLGLVGTELCLYLTVMLVAALVTVLTGSRIASLAVVIALMVADVILSALSHAGHHWIGTVQQLNPMHFVFSISRAWAEPEILAHAWLLVAVAVPVCLAGCAALLHRRELS